MTDYRALAARLLCHGPAMREAAAALTEAAVEIEYLENSLKMGVLRDSEQEIKLWRERAEAAAIKDEPTTVEIAPPGKHTIISSPQAPLSFKDEPQRSAVESKSQRELNHLRNALDRLNDDCLRAEQKRDQLRECNARLVLEATDYIHAVETLFKLQPEGDCLAERRPTKDDAAYRAFIYLNDQGKLLCAALAANAGEDAARSDQSSAGQVSQSQVGLDTPQASRCSVPASAGVPDLTRALLPTRFDQLRPEVLAFAAVMESKLRANDHKTHWRECSLDYLLTRLEQEALELREAINCGDGVISEAADVANFAMMIADIVQPRSAKEER